MIIIQLLERHLYECVTWGAAVDGINMCTALLSVDFVKSILLSSVTRAIPSNLSSYYCSDTRDNESAKGGRVD